VPRKEHIRFIGELAKPPILRSDAAVDAAALAEWDRRFHLLIDPICQTSGLRWPEDSAQLCTLLAALMVPALGTAKPKKVTTARKKWTHSMLERLLNAVSDKKASAKTTKDREALWLIVNDPQLRQEFKLPKDKGSRTDEKRLVETLESRLQDAKSNRRALLSFAEKHPELGPALLSSLLAGTSLRSGQSGPA
jgi:hypothetical protein